MDAMFVDILKKLISEQGRDALLDPSKCKALLLDFAGDYKKESRLLMQAIEIGVQKIIDTTSELELCKQQQIRVLQEEHFLTEEAAADVVNTLALVLRGNQESSASSGNICPNCGRELQKEWKTCPFCPAPADMPAAKTGRAAGSVANSTAKASYAKGKRFLDNCDWTTAIAEFTEAIRLDQKNADAYRSRGFCYSEDGQYDDAIKDFTEAIRLDPKNADAYRSRGACYFEDGQYDDAIKDFTEAIRLDPKDAEAYCIRGYAYSNKEEASKAKRDFDIAISLNPSISVDPYYKYF